MKCKRILSLCTALALTAGVCPAVLAAEPEEPVHTLVLSSEEAEDGSWNHTAVYDGTAVQEYDYTWNIDPSQIHDEVSGMPSVWYTGTEPSEDETVYIAHDIFYYPELDPDSFVLQTYDGEREWCYYYPLEEYEGYIFSTLPVQGSSVPTQMMHSADEAWDNAVLHITEAGTYSITGDWHGQIWIDLGEDAFDDPSAKVTVLLNGVDVTCTVAPALVFANVYECDNTWEDQDSWSSAVDTSEAGANVILADGTVNNFSGTNIYRLLTPKFKKDTSAAYSGSAQKKYLKIDGAFYSYMSMNLDGEEEGTGVLNLTGGYEGLDSELHLTINGGSVNINSQDDGINVNEDGVSVVTINGGSLHIAAGLGSEGDGIDSNGFLVINGGTVISNANPASDSGLDSDFGSYINGGYVVATGSTMDWAESDSDQVTMNLQFSSQQGADEAIIVTDLDGNVVFAYDPDQDETAGTNRRGYQGAILSCPEFEVGASYYVYVGGDVYGTEVNGLYDASTVTGFSGEAVQQCYSGTDVGFVGAPGGMTDPGGFGGMSDFGGETISLTEEEAEQLLELLSQYGLAESVTAEQLAACTTYQEMMDLLGLENFGFEAGESGMAGGFDTPDVMDPSSGEGQNPQSDFDLGEMIPGFSDDSFGSDMPDQGFESQQPGQDPGFGGENQGGMDGMMPGAGSSQESQQSGASNLVFFMTDKVNSFSGVTDYVSSSSIRFTDVPQDSYYYDAVVWAVQNGITTGATDDTFLPEDSCTRAQAVTFLWRAFGSPEPETEDCPFYDVSEDSYYYSAVLWAVEQGITLGTSETTFSPDEEVTRAQAVTFLYRAAGEPVTEGVLAFEDVAVSAYYADAVLWASEQGITLGTSETAFSPDDPVTRAQIVTFLYRDLA